MAELGLRVVQLTYNTANAVGCGCYEERDGGLTGFGRELVHELNRHRILIDLSHVGRQTAMDALQISAQPVAYTHCLPAALKDHPRNKTDDELRAVAGRGGFIGVTFFPSFMQRGEASTIADYLDALEYVIDLVGEQNVGIGTDFTEGHGPSFVDYITRDKGIGRRLTEFAPTMLPTDLTGCEGPPTRDGGDGRSRLARRSDHADSGPELDGVPQHALVNGRRPDPIDRTCAGVAGSVVAR